MKRFFFSALLLSAISFAVQAQALTLDAALTKASLVIGAPMSSTAKVAVISYETPSKLFSDYIGETLTYNLRTKINREVIGYRNFDTLRTEYTLTGVSVSETRALEIGKALAVDRVLLVTVKQWGASYQMTILPLTVADGKIGSPVRYILREDDLFAELLKGPPVTEQNSAPTESAVRRLRAQQETANEGL
jgi:hypothetical protein